MTRSFKQIDTAARTWAVDRSNYIYGLLNGKWKRVAGRLNHVSSGRAGVWGIMGNKIYYRNMRKRALGISWRRVPGGLVQIDSGPRGIVCGVNGGNNIYCRLQIIGRVPYGRRWINVPGKVKYISCGDYGYWGVNKANHIFFRQGVSRSRPQGWRWIRIPGLLNQVEAGRYGQVAGVNKQGQMFVRTGVTQQRPQGRGWKRVQGIKSWLHTSVGRGYLYSVDSFKSAYKSTLGAVAGKNFFAFTQSYTPELKRIEDTGGKSSIIGKGHIHKFVFYTINFF